MVVYLTINLINKKKYIGKDSNNNPNYLGSGVYLKQAIKKYGKDNFKKIIIEKVTDISKLNEREEYWINIFNAYLDKNYYNLTEKGKGFPKGQKRTKHYRRCINQYDLDDNFIKEWSSIKEAEEYYKMKVGGISNNCKGKYKSAGGFIWRYKDGKIENEKPKRFRYVKVIQYDLNINLIKEWDSIKEASEKLGICYATIINVCQNYKNENKSFYKTCGGYIWKYKL